MSLKKTTLWGYYVSGELMGLCRSQSTAVRLANEAGREDGSVRAVTAIDYEGMWYGPVKIIPSSVEDLRQEEKIKNFNTAVKKAAQAGLTADEIAILAKGSPI
jgi:hypothetical protein